MAELSNTGRPRIFAVIVLYRMEPANSIAFKSLQAAMSDKADVRVLLFDNTPGGCRPGPLPHWAQYEPAKNNAGLAAAYNRALNIAEEQRSDWLLTLDQDTNLPKDFLSLLIDTIEKVSADESVAAIVPRIMGDGKVISPGWWLWDAIPRVLPADFIGICKRNTSAINSASTLRVSALRKIGGYEQRYWLDCSDMYIFLMFHKYGMQIYVAGDIEVGHQLSILNMNERVTLERYKNILSAGCAFWDMELGWLAALDYNARLIYRTFFKHWKQGHDPAFRRASMDMLKKRLFQSRRRRISAWKKETDRWIA